MEIIGLILSGLSVTSAIIFAILTNKRADKHETEDKATSIAVINSDLGYVKSGIDRIERKQSTSDEFIRELTAKVSEAKDSAKSAHHRLDMHEARIVKLEHEQE